MSQTTINPDAPMVTLINVFTVAPEDQKRLITLWQQATDDIIRHLPGFISANIHASPDGTKVVNYAQWESPEAFNAMRQNPDASAHLRELAQIGTPAPVLCNVISVHHPNPGPDTP
ncbi:MAG: antibiotic biosynthesis monooxygenase family protein [Solirubrobacteraceae bacterium]